MFSNNTTSYPEHTVQITSLQDLGYFAKVSFGDVKPNITSSPDGLQQSKIIFVVDRSGSMGSHFPEIIRTVIPSTLLSLGFPSSHRVDIVTFDSFLDATTNSIDELRHDTRTARGSTYMALVFDKLYNMIQNIESAVPVSIVVISDGEIMDKPKTLTEASRVSAKVSRSAPISVIPIRLLTSPSASPDTKALAAVALMNSAGPVPLIEHKVYTDKETYTILSKELVRQLRKSVTSYGSIVAGAEVLRSVPQSQGLCKIALTSKVNFILIDPNTDLSSIVVNGRSLMESVDSSGENSQIQILQSEQEIQPFLEFILSWLKVRMVVGQTDGHFQAVIAWFQRLQTIIEQSGTVNGTSTASNVLLRDRLVFVRNLLRKRSSSLMNEVLQFANASRLDNLNSNQLADYLRSDVKSKATARRMENNQNTAGSSWKEHAQTLLKKLSKVYDQLHKTSTESPDDCSQEELMNGLISFFSQATAEECLFAAKDFLQEQGDIEQSDFDNVEIYDLLQLSGGLGLCFNANRTDLPDPWQYKVNEVYIGNYFLSEADIRTSEDMAISYPGTGTGTTSSIVTGVLPLMKLNKQLYEIYNFGELRLLSELQAGVTMRGVLGSIPYDVLAMNAAVLFKVMSSIPVKEKATALQCELIEALKMQITAHINRYAKNAFAGIAYALVKDEDPRPYLIGANDANAVLKLFCILVGHEACAMMSETQLMKVITILYDLAAYTSAKHHFRRVEYLIENQQTNPIPAEMGPLKSRSEALIDLLQIDMEEFRHSTDVGKPFEPDPEFSPSMEVNIEACAEKLPEWLPSASKFAAVYRWMRPATDCSTEEPLTTVYEAFGCQTSSEFHLFKLWIAANAIVCSDEDARIDKDKGMSRSCLPNDLPEVLSELQSMVDKICKRDFDERLVNKRNQEAAIALETLVTDLLQCESEEEFVSLLNTGRRILDGESGKVTVTIRDRSAEGYSILMDHLSATTNMDGNGLAIRLRFKKLAILLTGRIVGTDQAVWNNGNVYRQSLLPFADLFKNAGKEEFWIQVTSCIMANTKHTYRSALSNRHGHGEEKPSFYAMGFPTLLAFEDACKGNIGCYSMKDWKDYVAVHTNCCGFGIKFKNKK